MRPTTLLLVPTLVATLAGAQTARVAASRPAAHRPPALGGRRRSDAEPVALAYATSQAQAGPQSHDWPHRHSFWASDWAPWQPQSHSGPGHVSQAHAFSLLGIWISPLIRGRRDDNHRGEYALPAPAPD